MAFKKMDDSLCFADLALASSLKHNRSLKLMGNLNASIDWKIIESVLLSHYSVGGASEGADTYLPLLLFKCLLLQKWFRINSDPELENQSLSKSFSICLLANLRRATLLSLVSEKDSRKRL